MTSLTRLSFPSEVLELTSPDCRADLGARLAGVAEQVYHTSQASALVTARRPPRKQALAPHGRPESHGRGGGGGGGPVRP